jgi:hypothetical protein
MIIFEMNVRVLGKPLDRIAEEHIGRLVEMGFSWVWLMGLWHIGPAAIAISKRYGEDFQGSPYAIASYEVSPELGGEAALAAFVERAHAAGLRVMADFVPNHMAVDSPLIDAHPEFVIHSNPVFRPEAPHDYFDHPKGRLAHGKDPYFPGWTDTVQLDYAHPGLRAHQIETLKRLATMVDGVRCDMAMLVLREYVKSNWFPRLSQELFDQHYPREFWAHAIEAVKEQRRDFVFMAEVYWDKEPYLQSLGFDLTYDKKLYDLLSHARLEDVGGYLAWASHDYLARSVHFIENHDEERAAVRFVGRTHAASILSYAIPGAPFVHQGQMEGFTEKLPVQRIHPLTREAPDPGSQAFYARLLACIKAPIFREGEMVALGVQHGVLLLVRRHEGRTILVGADPTGRRRDASPPIELSLDRLGLARGAHLRGEDLWTGVPIDTGAGTDYLTLAEGAIPSWPDNQGFLLELSEVERRAP